MSPTYDVDHLRTAFGRKNRFNIICGGIEPKRAPVKLPPVDKSLVTTVNRAIVSPGAFNAEEKKYWINNRVIQVADDSQQYQLALLIRDSIIDWRKVIAIRERIRGHREDITLDKLVEEAEKGPSQVKDVRIKEVKAYFVPLSEDSRIKIMRYIIKNTTSTLKVCNYIISCSGRASYSDYVDFEKAFMAKMLEDDGIFLKEEPEPEPKRKVRHAYSRPTRNYTPAQLKAGAVL